MHTGARQGAWAFRPCAGHQISAPKTFGCPCVLLEASVHFRRDPSPESLKGVLHRHFSYRPPCHLSYLAVPQRFYLVTDVAVCRPFSRRRLVEYYYRHNNLRWWQPSTSRVATCLTNHVCSCGILHGQTTARANAVVWTRRHDRDRVAVNIVLSCSVFEFSTGDIIES